MSMLDQQNTSLKTVSHAPPFSKSDEGHVENLIMKPKFRDTQP